MVENKLGLNRSTIINNCFNFDDIHFALSSIYAVTKNLNIPFTKLQNKYNVTNDNVKKIIYFAPESHCLDWDENIEDTFTFLGVANRFKNKVDFHEVYYQSLPVALILAKYSDINNVKIEEFIVNCMSNGILDKFYSTNITDGNIEKLLSEL